MPGPVHTLASAPRVGMLCALLFDWPTATRYCWMSIGRSPFGMFQYFWIGWNRL